MKCLGKRNLQALQTIRGADTSNAKLVELDAFLSRFVAYLNRLLAAQSSRKLSKQEDYRNNHTGLERRAKPAMLWLVSARTARVHTKRHTGAMPGDPAHSCNAVLGSRRILGPDGRGPC